MNKSSARRLLLACSAGIALIFGPMAVYFFMSREYSFYAFGYAPWPAALREALEEIFWGWRSSREANLFAAIFVGSLVIFLAAWLSPSGEKPREPGEGHGD
jgi:hypothetical protein